MAASPTVSVGGGSTAAMVRAGAATVVYFSECDGGVVAASLLDLTSGRAGVFLLPRPRPHSPLLQPLAPEASLRVSLSRGPRFGAELRDRCAPSVAPAVGISAASRLADGPPIDGGGGAQGPHRSAARGVAERTACGWSRLYQRRRVL